MKRLGHFLGLVVSLVFTGCFDGFKSKQEPPPPPPTACAPYSLKSGLGGSGQGKIFQIDPMISSGNPYLSPLSTRLDEYTSSVPLQNLTGQGVLRGSLVEVRNGLQCLGGFGAFEPQQQFNYAYHDFKFQEVMSYYYADDYQSHLKRIGYLNSSQAVRVYAHCELEDNAYFTWARDTQTGQYFQMVCLGDSVETQGASYSDDAQVIIHELQHAATGDQYSSEIDLNQLYYDEAGSLNEAISDFMALAYTDSTVELSSQFDPRVFSRWALGTFFQGSDGSRGAHLCPKYDPHYPNCDSFPQFSAPQSSSAAQGAVSYVYPDGLGWPYQPASVGSNPIVDTFKYYAYQEEIHNTGALLTGALWDAYSLLKQNHTPQEAFDLMSRLVLESIRHLPQPDTIVNHSPVTFPQLAQKCVTYSAYVPGWSAQDRAQLIQVLTQRGLYGAAQIGQSDWLAIGSGTNFRMKISKTPGLKIVDDALVLKRWINEQGGDSNIVQQNLTQSLNSQLDPGEVAMIWFDLQNNSRLTAGGVLLTVTSLDPDVEILDSRYNIGYLSGSGQKQTQVMYGKINGTDIVSALNPGGRTEGVPTDHTYFGTNPYFAQSYRTGIWIRALPTAAHGKWVKFRVQATPSNGVSSTQEFSLQVH